METSNDESYAGRSLSVKTSLICRPPLSVEEAIMLNDASYLNVRLLHEDIHNIRDRGVTITLQENENEDILKSRRCIKHQNVLHLFNHFKPHQNFTGHLVMSPQVGGTLLHLIKGLPWCFFTGWVRSNDIRLWFGSPILSSILRQVATTINDLHKEDITLGDLSTTSIFYTMENLQDPSIKLDWTVNEHGRRVSLYQRKMHDWRLFADLLYEIYRTACSELNSKRCRVDFSVEFEDLCKKLRIVCLNLDTVKNLIVYHPALWNGERSLFLFEFVGEMVFKMKVGDKKLEQAITRDADNILPPNYKKNWTLLFPRDIMASMNRGRSKYRQQNNQKGSLHYDGSSVVEYILFMRDYIRHSSFEKNPSERELVFRAMQATSMFRLYKIAQDHRLINNFLSVELPSSHFRL